jgi:hypothetical protein
MLACKLPRNRAQPEEAVLSPFSSPLHGKNASPTWRVDMRAISQVICRTIADIYNAAALDKVYWKKQKKK